MWNFKSLSLLDFLKKYTKYVRNASSNSQPIPLFFSTNDWRISRLYFHDQLKNLAVFSRPPNDDLWDFFRTWFLKNSRFSKGEIRWFFFLFVCFFRTIDELRDFYLMIDDRILKFFSTFNKSISRFFLRQK